MAMNKVRKYKRKKEVIKMCKRCKKTQTTSGNALYCYECKDIIITNRSNTYHYKKKT